MLRPCRCRSSRFRTSRRGATPTRSPRCATRSRRPRGCSTSTRTRITTAPSSRSSARRASSSRRSPAGSRRPIGAHRPRAGTRARTRASGPPTSCRSSPLRPEDEASRASRGARARRPARLGARAPGLLLRTAHRGRAGAGVLPPRRRRGARPADRDRRARPRPRAGPAASRPPARVLVGVRRPLIAFNVNLRAERRGGRAADRRRVRERDGGFPGVRALGLALPPRVSPGEHERDRLGGVGAPRDRRGRSPPRPRSVGWRWPGASSSASCRQEPRSRPRGPSSGSKGSTIARPRAPAAGRKRRLSASQREIDSCIRRAGVVTISSSRFRAGVRQAQDQSGRPTTKEEQ